MAGRNTNFADCPPLVFSVRARVRSAMNRRCSRRAAALQSHLGSVVVARRRSRDSRPANGKDHETNQERRTLPKSGRLPQDEGRRIEAGQLHGSHPASVRTPVRCHQRGSKRPGTGQEGNREAARKSAAGDPREDCSERPTAVHATASCHPAPESDRFKTNAGKALTKALREEADIATLSPEAARAVAGRSSRGHALAAWPYHPSALPIR